MKSLNERRHKFFEIHGSCLLIDGSGKKGAYLDFPFGVKAISLRIVKKWLSSNKFLVLLLSVLGLAFLFPAPGAKGGWLRPEITVALGTAALFLVQGLLIPFDQLRRGMLRFRVHALLQLWMFVGMPVLIGIMLFLWPQTFPEGLRLGFWYLAILPTTVSTAIVYTTASGGDTSIALFNTTLSNVAGVFLVPLVCTLIVVSVGAEVELGGMFTNIATRILLPFCLGQFLRAVLPIVRDWVIEHKKLIGSFCSYVMLFIVYCSFAESVKSAFWEGQELHLLLGVLSLTLSVLILSKIILWPLTGMLGYNRGIRVAFLFCGSQKTLVAGIPLAQSIFGNSSFDVGLIVMPLLFYHVLQLSIGGILVNHFAKQA